MCSNVGTVAVVAVPSLHLLVSKVLVLCVVCQALLFFLLSYPLHTGHDVLDVLVITALQPLRGLACDTAVRYSSGAQKVG